MATSFVNALSLSKSTALQVFGRLNNERTIARHRGAHSVQPVAIAARLLGPGAPQPGERPRHSVRWAKPDSAKYTLA
jgi:hypothetical protein